MTVSAAQHNPNKLWLPDLGKEIDRPWFLPNEQALREQHKILTSVFYLVRQGDTFGERLPCVRCGRRETYITLNCIPKPFNGMVSGLYAYYSLMRYNNIDSNLSPEARARVKQISNMLGRLPDLSSVHPEMARKMMASLGVNDEMTGALSIGVLEGIAPKEARALAERINDTGIKPRFVLGVPSKIDLYRAIDYTRKVNSSGFKVHWTN